MRFFIAIILVFVSMSCNAAQVKCYSNGKLIYSGNGEEVGFLDPLFTFKENGSNRIVFVNADCVVKI